MSVDEKYAKALLLRDNKVPELTKDQSTIEAENLFLELGEKGHTKAMHNYAVIQQKKGKYKLAFECYSQAGLEQSFANIKAMKECGQIKEDLFLVVGSDRGTAGNHGSPILDVVFGRDVDLTHSKSFGGNATTCDTNPSFIPGAKHIVADAETFDFAKRYNLKHVVLERFPTASARAGYGGGPINTEADPAAFSGSAARARTNYFGSVLVNLSRAMQAGATLEIEWDPYNTLGPHTPEQLETYRTLNPFHGFVHSVAVFAVMAMHSGDVSFIPAEFKPLVTEAMEAIRREVTFWHSLGAGKSVKEIVDRMEAERGMYHNMLMPQARNQPAQYALLEADLVRDPSEKVIAAANSAVFDTFDPALVEHTHRLPDGRVGTVHSPDTLMRMSLLGAALGSMAVQQNAPYAKRYLESIGFVDVRIERRTNTHNGRNNVWMVTATKA